MNKILIACICASTTCIVFGRHFYSSQTFMYNKPVYQNIGASSFEWRSLIANKESNNGFAARVTPIYQQSLTNITTSNKKLARQSYFLIDCKQEILVAGDNAPASVKNVRDVRAEWLGLSPSYQGKLTFHPEQKQFGLILSLNQDVKNWIDSDFVKSWWLDITCPVVYMLNKLNPCESAIENIPNGMTLIQALQQGTWNYGKIYTDSHKRWALGEIDLMWGSWWEREHDFLLQYYTGFIIPGTHRQRAEYLFDSAIGSNGHFGFLVGCNLELPLTDECNDCACKLFANADLHYLFPRKEHRTFDLIGNHANDAQGKQWSRFLILRPNNVAHAPDEPGVNILTQKVSVHPYSFFNLATGAMLVTKNVQIELAYTLWAHPTEHIRWIRPSCEQLPHRIEEYGIAGPTAGHSASNSTIAEQASDDTVFTTLHQEQLDQRSGASRSECLQGVHGGIGVYCAGGAFVGIGGFYETPMNNAALEQWGIWATLGCAL
jgi:hypothetical protein